MRSHQDHSGWKFVVLLMCCEVMFTSAPLATISAHARNRSNLAPAPKAVTPFTSFNFGDVYTGEFISQIFIIRNEGEAELKILDFKGS